MTEFLTVFCRSASAVLQREIAEFVIDGVYFDQTPDFEPPSALDSAGTATWQSLTINYDAERRPIVIWRNSNDELFKEEIRETLEELEALSSPKATDLHQHVSQTKLTFAFEIKPDSMTDDAWAMVDSLEAFLARRCDGVIYARGHGFFDRDLVSILEV